MKYKNDVKKAFVATLPVFAGYIALGFGFGILLTSKGYGVIWALCMSVTMYAGSMQYAAVDILADGASLLSAAITTLAINARHLFYGISLVDKYKGTGIKKIYLMHALTDETYSLISSDEITKGVENKHLYYFLISIFDHCYWILGCCLGAIFGTTVTFNSEGIDFVLTALFITIFVEQWLSSKDHVSALIGVCSAAVSTVIFKEDMLIPTLILISVSLFVLRYVRRDSDG